MAKLSFEQLIKTLPRQPLSPVYLITGDEPLTAQESSDAVRNAARQVGFGERELYHADSNFQWSQLMYSANSMSLFAERKIIEIRVHDGKPGDAGSKALIEYCRAPSSDNLLLLMFPKIERASQNSKWYQAIEAIGAVVTIWPVDAKQMPRWINQRLQRAGIRADPQAIDILASRVEGNLLAAAQEIEKLKLIAKDGIIDSQTMASAVVDSARYDVFGLVDKALSGNAQAAAVTLNGLRGEGSEPTVILWALTREIRALMALKQALSNGQALESVARSHGIFEQRIPMIRGALQRLSAPTLRLLIKECAYIDRTIKGMASGNCWGTLLDVVLTLSGHRAFSGQVLKTLLQ